MNLYSVHVEWDNNVLHLFLKNNKILKRAMNFSSVCCIFFLADHTSTFCSSLVDLRTLPWRLNEFWQVFLLLFLPNIAQSCSFFCDFLIHTVFSIWYLGAINLKSSIIESYCLCSMQKCQISLIRYIFDPDCSYSLYIFLQVGKKSYAKRGLERFRIHCQNSAIKMEKRDKKD